jgi:hypothetical protein
MLDFLLGRPVEQVLRLLERNTDGVDGPEQPRGSK